VETSGQQLLCDPPGVEAAEEQEPTRRDRLRRRFFGYWRHAVSPVQTIAYRASGGDSERRSYASGEGLTIESQDDGYVLAWSAETRAQDFLRIVSRLVDDSAETELLLPPEFAAPTDETAASNEDRDQEPPAYRALLPLAEALTVAAGHPEVEAIEVNADDETFMWTMTDPYARERHDLTRVLMAFSVLNPSRVEQLIEDTGAPHVKNDLASIIASAEYLTHSAPSATA
jgi:hypothetical protein